MNDVVTGVIRWVLRLVVLAMGVLFFLSLLAAAAVLALVWGLRALWARLPGRPVTTWVMGIDQSNGWRNENRSTARWKAQRPEPPRRDDHDVTDVVPREIR